MGLFYSNIEQFHDVSYVEQPNVVSDLEQSHVDSNEE